MHFSKSMMRETSQCPVLTNTTDQTVSSMQSPESNRCFASASFVYTVVDNLGLCVEVTDYLAWVLQLNAITQVVISLTGIVGAALSLAVTCLKRSRSSLSLQVALLSLYDLLFLSSVLVLAILYMADVQTKTATGLFLVVRQLGQWGVTYTMLDISVDRCISIDRPFLAKKLFGVGFTLKKAAAILVAGLISTLPFLLDLIFGFSTDGECNRVERSLTLFGIVYTLYFVILFFCFLPFIFIVVANVKLVVALQRVGKGGPAMPAVTSSCSAQADTSAKQLSFFVVGVSAWYSACMLTPSILFLVRLTRIEVFEPERDIVAAVVADSLIVLSVAANFLFYFLMWRRFRHTFLKMFCSRCRGVDLDHSDSDPAGHGTQPIHNTSSSSDHLNHVQKTTVASKE